MMIMPGSMGMSVPISPMPNNSRVTHQTRVSERRWGMLSFLSGSRAGGKVCARLADDVERKKGGINCCCGCCGCGMEWRP